MSKTSASRSRLFVSIALVALAVQLLPEVQVSDLASADSAFAVPSALPSHGGAAVAEVEAEVKTDFVTGFLPKRDESSRADNGRTSRNAAVGAYADIGHKVLTAMGAGAVAAVIQAALSAVGEPIVNRVLVKRMKVMEAINDVKPSMMLKFFKTTLTTNFLKFPFFEAIHAFCAAMPISPSVRGIFTGFVFTSATLPVTNYRYRKSMQLEVNWGNIYEAYPPTVTRDMVYAICRNHFTMWALGWNPAWKATSPQLLFIVVILACLGSAPFNEWRGFLLQSQGKQLTFKQFFKPSNFVRSTSLGAFQQGLALAVGYWCAPPVRKFVFGVIASIKG